MISFVILHYKNIDETIECLQKLKKIINNHIVSIIVVDNNSLTKTEEKRLRPYTKDILKLDKNYGFAKANNKGIKYAQKKYNPDFVCAINNDVFIEDKEYIDKILDDFNKYDFDMLGPSIDSPTGDSINPFPVFKNKLEIFHEINKAEKLKIIYSSQILTSFLNFYIKIKSKITKKQQRKNGEIIQFNIALHGCAIIFSKKYLNKYKDPFFNDTFLFHEEEFLYFRMIKDNLKTMYDPKLKVFHKEGASIKKIAQKERITKLFRETERLKSLQLLIKYIEKCDEQ